jgi:hypothetical protein
MKCRLLLCACLAWGVVPASATQSAEHRALSEPLREADREAALALLRALAARIRAAIEAGQSEFTFHNESVYPDSISQRWHHGAERVHISIQVTSSAEEALRTMREMPNRLAAPLGPALPLPAGIGDHGYLYARVDRGGTSIVHFVRGEKFVVVSGPGDQIPPRFAAVIANELR